MTAYVESIEIQQKLIAMAEAGPFYAVIYAVGNRSATDIDADAPPSAVSPASAVAHEIRAGFAVETTHGRARKRVRDSWTWRLIVQFDGEVTGYEAEELWMTTPQRIAKGTNNRRQVTLELEDASYTHPTRQQSQSGTRIEYTFNARLSRR